MLKLLPILTFMATSAFAINTKDCPSNLQVKAAEISITKSIEQVLKGVAGDVKKSIPTQMPWYSSSITGEFYFRP